MTEMFQKDILRVFILLKYHVCKVEGQNKTLSKINLNYLLITYGLVHIKDIVVITHKMGNLHAACCGLIPGEHVPAT